MLIDDWAKELAREIAERYCQRFEVEAETATVLKMIERRCPLRKGVVYVEIEGTPSGGEPS